MNTLRGGGEESFYCKKLHNEELNDLYSSPNIVQVIKSKIMRWAVHVALWGGERRTQDFGGET
jgi:hypothetical protein